MELSKSGKNCLYDLFYLHAFGEKYSLTFEIYTS